MSYSNKIFSTIIPKSLPSILVNLERGVEGLIILIVIVLIPSIM